MFEKFLFQFQNKSQIYEISRIETFISTCDPTYLKYRTALDLAYFTILECDFYGLIIRVNIQKSQ